MKAHGGADEWILVFLTSALVGGECSVSRPGRLRTEFIWIVVVTNGGLVNTVMNIFVLQNEGNFLIS
jgi:hypothetical protein